MNVSSHFIKLRQKISTLSRLESTVSTSHTLTMIFSTSVISNPSNRHYYAATFPIYARFTQSFALSTYSPPFPPGQTAYDILGVPETSSFSQIKSSFHKLAKLTHPDLSHSSASSPRFLQILAAYEILSDLEKRAHYDSYLLSLRKKVVHKQSNSTVFYSYEPRTMRHYDKEMEVVEWLRWYRMTINNVLAEKRVATGTGYFDELEADFYSAIYSAYYGPLIESMELLPDRFEAEERSVWDTNEVLHLVSGRDLFGMVCLVNDGDKTSQLDSFVSRERLESFKCVANGSSVVKSNVVGEDGDVDVSDIYRDLELLVSGKVVAMANRIPPGSQDDGEDNAGDQDKIEVFLTSGVDYAQGGDRIMRNSFVDVGSASMIPVGTIVGLGTSGEEGSCFVYDSRGIKTHVIMKHRTLLVKHLHWYNVGDEISVCECRCSRAQLPPSKYWLFEPRCEMHDIGGWYVEMFGRDKKGRTVPSQRYWDGLDGSEQYDRRLHPAMYLLALAYRTLDIEDAKRRKRTIRTFVEGQLFRVLRWCKKLI